MSQPSSAKEAAPTPEFKGGSFLFEKVGEHRPFLPEDLSDEALAFKEVVEKFVRTEVLPVSDQIESQDFNLTRRLLRKAGELGILGAAVPPEFGGLGLDQITLTAITENLAWQTSFGVTLIAHSGIGTLPVLYFAQPQIKEKYLPKLASGEMIGAYCLTEPDAGSDIFAMKSTAVLAPDGKSWTLNGEKRFITNGAIADLFTVFANVNGSMSAFLVERETPGLSLGREERKMGIKGSSTVSVHLENVNIPYENLLGAIGKGHKIALNILNFGRFRLGVACTGIAKWLIGEVAQYVKQRFQFGAPLSDYGAIQNMMADQVIRTFVSESTLYRTAGVINQVIDEIDPQDPARSEKIVKISQEFAIEAAMAKVFGSECLCFVADRAVQMLGGYGFIENYHPARVFRDARINCIFEGTNEINRIQQIALKMLSRSLKDEIPTKLIWETIGSGQSSSVDVSGPLQMAVRQAELAKDLAIFCYGLILSDEKLLETVTTVPRARDRGEFFDMDLAELTLGAYGIDSTVKRASQIMGQFGEEIARVPIAITQVYANDEYNRMMTIAKDFVVKVAGAAEPKIGKLLSKLKKMECFDAVDTACKKMQIAEHVFSKESYSIVNL